MKYFSEKVKLINIDKGELRGEWKQQQREQAIAFVMWVSFGVIKLSWRIKESSCYHLQPSALKFKAMIATDAKYFLAHTGPVR